MGSNAIDRLKNFLAQLPPQSQALLMREFERAIERGEDATVPNLVLEQLRKVVRQSDDNDRSRGIDDAFRLSFNAACVPLTWRSIEPIESAYRWDEADAARNEIEAAGYVIEDTAEGPRVVKKQNA